MSGWPIIIGMFALLIGSYMFPWERYPQFRKWFWIIFAAFAVLGALIKSN